MDVISSMSKGELFSAYNIVKAYYEVSMDSDEIATAPETSFYLSVPDDSLLMDEKMISSAPVAPIVPIAASPSFYLSVPDDSLLMNEHMDLGETTITASPSFYLSVNPDESLLMNEHIDLGETTIAASSSFYLAINPDESLLMNQEMISSAPVAPLTASPSFYLSVNLDQSLLMDEKMISSAPVAPVAASTSFYLSIKPDQSLLMDEKMISPAPVAPVATTRSAAPPSAKSQPVKPRVDANANQPNSTLARIRAKRVAAGYAIPSEFKTLPRKTTAAIAPIVERPKRVNLKNRVSLAPRRVAAK
jgi:hypothetical protein